MPGIEPRVLSRISKPLVSCLPTCSSLSFCGKIYLTKLPNHRFLSVFIPHRKSGWGWWGGEATHCAYTSQTKSSGCGPLYRRTAMHGGLQVLAATLLFGRGLWEPWPPALQRWCCWRAGRQAGRQGLGGPGYFGGERAGMAEQ